MEWCAKEWVIFRLILLFKINSKNVNKIHLNVQNNKGEKNFKFFQKKCWQKKKFVVLYHTLSRERQMNLKNWKNFLKKFKKRLDKYHKLWYNGRVVNETANVHWKVNSAEFLSRHQQDVENNEFFMTEIRIRKVLKRNLVSALNKGRKNG